MKYLIKILYILAIWPFFSFCESPITTGYYSIQPKKEPFNSTQPIVESRSVISQSQVDEKEERDYLVYEITTPSLTKLYSIDDFDIDLQDKFLTIKGKVCY